MTETVLGAEDLAREHALAIKQARTHVVVESAIFIALTIGFFVAGVAVSAVAPRPSAPWFLIPALAAGVVAMFFDIRYWLRLRRVSDAAAYDLLQTRDPQQEGGRARGIVSFVLVTLVVLALRYFGLR